MTARVARSRSYSSSKIMIIIITILITIIIMKRVKEARPLHYARLTMLDTNRLLYYLRSAVLHMNSP